VAANAGALAGYHLLFFRAGSDIARLYSIAVDPAWRRAGLAKGLLADAERTARKRRCRRLRLEVRADNPLAVRLYERQGYRSIGRRPEYYADRADALLYEKQLGARTDEDRSPRDSDRRSAYIEPVQGAKPAVPRNAAPNVPPHAEPLPPPR
jgi:ribosomal protein S18 acetylase RimI-like enzyme